MQLATITKTGEQLMMLEVKDLRIGNSVLWQGKLAYITALTLDIDDEYQEAIYVCLHGEHSGEKGGWERSIITDLRPIPLTPEILEKAGFETFGGRYSKRIDEYILLVVDPADFYRYGFYSFSKDFEDHHNPIILSQDNFVESLHQLQNLYFALTGTELEVSL